jgi:hypothetical protein
MRSCSPRSRDRPKPWSDPVNRRHIAQIRKSGNQLRMLSPRIGSDDSRLARIEGSIALLRLFARWGMREADAGARPQCATSGHAPTAGRRGQSTLSTPCGCWAENCPDERSDGARRTPSRTHRPLTLILFHRPLAQSLDGRKVPSGCLKLRIDTQRCLVVGDRSVEIAPAAEGRATVVVGVGERWVKLDRAVVVGDSAAQITLPWPGRRCRDW